MHKVTPTATTFALPAVADGPTTTKYVERLLEYHELMESGWVKLCFSERSMARLFEMYAYPLDRELRNVVQRAKLEEFSVGDIVRIVNDLLGRASLEEQTGISESLWSNIRTVPDTSELESRSEFRDDVATVLSSVAAAFALGSSRGEVHCVQVDSAPVPVSTLEGELIEVEWRRHSEASSALPRTVIQHIRIAEGPKHAITSLDPVDLWKTLASGFDVEIANKAITLAWYQSCQMNGIIVELSPGPWFRFGRGFGSSAEHLGFLHDEAKISRLITALVEVLLDRPSAKAHVLRTGRGGNNPQRERGNDGAWRQDIDYEFHLHYWLTTRGPEFANVVVHNDFAISE